ncbi:hypothetical protein SB724_19200 [Bacillus sp. SIMBA_031]|uniref:hypothetical protein n=1 Tax=Bacillus sp. SIMBA_031 TaxID=3085774 RepID=UPI00397E6A0E
MNIKQPIHNFIDSLFNPIISFLDLAIEKLEDVGNITAQGIDLGSYLSLFGDMPSSMQMCVTSLLISTTFIGGIIMFRSLVRIYYAVKESIPFL